jgi:hypothetical protein
MRRTALISGLLLTLTASVWGSALAAVSDACCMNDASAPNDVAAAAPASDEHDCCRAKLDGSNAPHSQSNEHAHASVATTHEDAPASKPQAEATHTGMDCMGAAEPESGATVAATAVGFVERGRSCFECCAGRGKQMPTTATTSAPEPNKAKRAALNVADAARHSFAHGAQGVAHLSPSQHAPPAPGERRHKLINVFLI